MLLLLASGLASLLRYREGVYYRRATYKLLYLSPVGLSSKIDNTMISKGFLGGEERVRPPKVVLFSGGLV